MKKIVFLIAFVAVFSVQAQDTDYEYFSYGNFIPKVTVNNQTQSFQGSLYPEFYKTHSVARDMRWVSRNDSLIVTFWENQGDTVLHVLTELSGLGWVESSFDIRLVRFYPSMGTPDPMVIPLGGMKDGSIIEAAPVGHQLILNLVYQLSHRMLAQANQPDHGVLHPIAYHPLMRVGPYTRNNLAMHLAIATCENLIGYDTAAEASRSAFFANHSPGHHIYDQYIRDQWLLTPQRTLSDWIIEEPYGSDLVAASRRPTRPKPAVEAPQVSHVEGLPIKGRFGFSVITDNDNFTVIDKIDTYRLAYACGLRSGDQIRRVDGALVRTHKALVEKLMESLQLSGGSTLEIKRDDRFRAVVIEPRLLPFMGEDSYLDDIELDELPVDSVSTDSDTTDREF